MKEEKPDAPWGTTRTINVVKEAVQDAIAKAQAPGIQEARLPIKGVIGLCLFLLTQALTVAGVYYDLRSDVRSLQESRDGLDALAQTSDLDALKARIDAMQKALTELESEMKSPPTSLDHMRVIGEMRADLRLLEHRLKWLEENK